MNRLHCLVTAAALAVGLLSPRLAAIPAAEATAGRELVQRYSDVVVEIELVVVLQVTIGEKVQPPRELKREVNGTVIAPNGLTVISLRSIDPSGAVPRSGNIKVGKPEYKEVKLRLADNTEVPAELVLMDEDLDLAFVKPVPAEPDRKFACVDLAATAPTELLGTYFDLARASKHLQRTPAIRIVEAIGLVEKPRELVLLSAYSAGCPVFDAQGRLLGISVRHIAEGRETGMILLPAASVAEIAPK